jgi:CubicO group peptidase (beta-lactamase class C family)
MSETRFEAGLLAMGLMVAACGTAPAEPDSSAIEATRFMQEFVPMAGFSGAVEISREGRILYSAAFGTADGDAPFTSATASDGGSLAKPMTALLALTLVEEGALSLDAPVRETVLEFPYPDVTLRALLDHSAALPGYEAFPELMDSGAPVTTRDLLAALPPENRRAAADAHAFTYCNLCYDMMALVIEKAAGAPFGELMERRLFVPAGMHGAFLRPARFADWPGQRTLGFHQGPDGLDLLDAFDNEGFHGGSNVWLTAADAGALARAWLPGSGHVPDAVRGLALSPSGPDAGGLTLGNWYCDAEKTRCHYRGHHQGFDSFAYWDGSLAITAAYVSNTGLPPAAQTALPRALIAIAEGRPVDPGQTPQGTALPSGWFMAPAGDLIELGEGPGLRVLRLGTGRSYTAYPTGAGMAYVPGLDWYLSTAAEGGLWLDTVLDGRRPLTPLSP